MKSLLSTLLMIAAATTMVAADKPDFSGSWKMDADKSNFGMVPPPTSMSSKITHKDPDVTIETAQNDQNATLKYSTDGKETTNSMMGNEMKSKAAWEGKVLVVNSTMDIGGAAMKMVSKYSLSDDGKQLTNNMSISAPQGDFEMTIVMVKQ